MWRENDDFRDEQRGIEQRMVAKTHLAELNSIQVLPKTGDNGIEASRTSSQR